MRLLVPGGGGMLARMLAQRARAAGHEAALLPRADWDIADAAAGEARIAAARPDAVVNCAAFTDVDACETRRAEAFRANAEGPGVLARLCASAGVPLLHLSSDYVFDGAARRPYPVDAPTGPLSAYGESKLAGEEAVRAAGGGWTVLRTAWVYGPWGRNFVSTVLRLAREQGRLRVVDDQTGSPTFTADLADAALALLGAGARGTFHFTNAGEVSWHGFASEILRLRGIPAPVEAVPTSAFPRPARRPAYSVLDASAYVRANGRTPRPWKEALAEFLAGPHAPG